ncbi:phosphoglycerate mutase [Rhabdochromatium marinum]|uniref:phosphoglycerate mutase n=1 Tax=Rhabdochromatium marinum TaxID=48729 RepID=UPI0019067E78|nr:phosphoglycerate mutase [Rhabdochromatium marinum]MBK1649541.1 hypothetical protein [Rhabdochromatium marinum]
MKASDGLDIELLIPGLLGPPQLPAASDSDTPALDQLLRQARASKPSATAATADQSPCTAMDALIRALGLDAAFAEQLPTAPYCLAVDHPNWDRTGFWLHADPVHLRADRDQLRLFDSQALAIQPDEARQLVAELNAHFRADGLRLYAPVPERWYLRAPEPLQLHTRSLRSVMGAPLAEAMPGGADARRWNALMNEAQMLMHQSSVNQARTAAGRPMINGLWCSGPGAYAALELAADFKLVIAEDLLPLGLAQAGQVPSSHPEDPGLLPQLERLHSGRVLLIELRLGDALLRRDLTGWEQALQRLDQQLAPLLTWALEWPPRAGSPARVVRLHDGVGHRWTWHASWFGGLRRHISGWFRDRLG